MFFSVPYPFFDTSMEIIYRFEDQKKFFSDITPYAPKCTVLKRLCQKVCKKMLFHEMGPPMPLF